MKTLFLITIFTFVGIAAHAQQPKVVEFINPSEWPKPPGYTHVVKVSGGTTIYLSGQVPTDAQGQIVGKNDFDAQARQVFENLQTALKAAGATFADVVKMNTYVVGLTIERRNRIREIRRNYLNMEQPPASTLAGVEALYDPEVLIEIEAIAVIK
ncbi:RidA family protein [Rhodoflexus caldus]|uniref:RidA family protein n=1 Tax=Rhodoflexus caldus TaxID=2891236 RepID=UPI00202A58DF|nr:RidA family protein [Rhodoflexus caldus]